MASRELTEEEEKIVAALESKHESIASCFVQDRRGGAVHLVVVRMASPEEKSAHDDKFRRSMMAQPGKGRGGSAPSSSDAERSLALSCIVHPNARNADGKAEVLKLFALQSGLISWAADKALALGSEGIEELEGN